MPFYNMPPTPGMNPAAVFPSPNNGFAIGFNILPIPPKNLMKPDFFFLGCETMLLKPVG